MASQCRCKASQRVKIQASRWNGHGMLGSRLRFPWGMRQGYSCWDAWFFWRFFWCSSCINRTRALSSAAFADSLFASCYCQTFFDQFGSANSYFWCWFCFYWRLSAISLHFQPRILDATNTTLDRREKVKEKAMVVVRASPWSVTA